MVTALGLILVAVTVQVQEVSGVDAELQESILSAVREEAKDLGADVILGVRIIGGVAHTLLVLERSSESSAVAFREVLLGTDGKDHRGAIKAALAELFPGRLPSPELTTSLRLAETPPQPTPWASIGLLSAGLVAMGLSVWLSAEAGATQAELDRRVFVDPGHMELASERDTERGAAMGLLTGGAAAMLTGALLLAFD